MANFSGEGTLMSLDSLYSVDASALGTSGTVTVV